MAQHNAAPTDVTQSHSGNVELLIVLIIKHYYWYFSHINGLYLTLCATAVCSFSSSPQKRLLLQVFNVRRVYLDSNLTMLL